MKTRQALTTVWFSSLFSTQTAPLLGEKKKKATLWKWHLQLVMLWRNMKHRKIEVKGFRYSSFHDRNYTILEVWWQCFFLQYQYQLSRHNLHSPHVTDKANFTTPLWQLGQCFQRRTCNSGLFQSFCLTGSAASIKGEFAFRGENFKHLLPKLIYQKLFWCTGAGDKTM